VGESLERRARAKWSTGVSARCAGRTAVGVRAQEMVHVVKRVTWDCDTLPRATVNMAFWCIIGKDRHTGTNPSYSRQRDPTEYTD